VGEGKDYQSKGTKFLAGCECSGLRESCPGLFVREDGCKSALAEYEYVHVQRKLVKKWN